MQRPHTNTYWLEPSRILAGEYPGDEDEAFCVRRLETYLDCGISDFLDLTTPGELQPYDGLLARLGERSGTEIGYARFPIVDRSVPDSLEQMREILDEVDRRVDAGGTVYVHCWGGVGRTGTVLGCYLVRQGLTGDAAIAQLARLWPQMEKSSWHLTTPETPQQFAYIRDWRER
ncbi:MAG: hypothetical protein OES37_05870 [Chromatiales bacterium]|nr:hypothetical protein [Chromatiales bacterium]